MDGNGFDELTRRLATGRTRRSVLRGLVGGGAALVAARTGASLAAPEDKTTICHWSEDLGYYEQISISLNGLHGHEGHGQDLLYPDFESNETCGNCNTACGEDEICGEAGCEPAPPVCSSRTIFADNPFSVDTGIFLGLGDSVAVSATGTAMWSSVDENGPDGTGGVCGGGDPSEPPFSCGSIVGVVGGGDIFTDPTPFTQLGSGPITITASSAGNLFLQYVDGCSYCYGDNSGSFEITIC